MPLECEWVSISPSGPLSLHSPLGMLPSLGTLPLTFQMGNQGLSDLSKEMGVIGGTPCPALSQTTGERRLLLPGPRSYRTPSRETPPEPFFLLKVAPDLPSLQ